MPSNSQFTINNFSPNFRDALLNRNLLADTVTNNSLDSWLDSINTIPDIGDGVGLVKGSEDIETEGIVYRGDNVKFNKLNVLDYRNLNIPYNSVDITFPDSLYSSYSTSPSNSPTNDGPIWRDSQNTILNLFKIGGTEYYRNDTITYPNTNITTNTSLVDLNTQNNPETDGVFRRELSITQNQFRSSNYERVTLALLPFETNASLATLNLNPNIYAPTLETYTNNHVPASGPFLGGNIREFTTSKNMFLDVAKQTRTVINTTSVATQHTSYIDYNNAFLGGSKTTRLVDVIGSALGGGGVGFDPNSGNPVPDFDVRSSLAGRALTSAGILDDTRLGQISPKYLSAAIGNNIAFNIQEETLGRVNTNLLNLAMGGDIIVPNNKITVKDGKLGLGADIIERMTGAKIPVSLLPKEADIFSYDTKGYIGMSNIDRANNMIANTGKGTVNNLFANIKSNVNVNFLGDSKAEIKSFRQGYAPNFNDEISDYQLYALDDGNGKVKDILSQTPANSPIPQSSYNLEGMVSTSDFDEDKVKDWAYTKDYGKTKFIWGDDKFNKITKQKFSTTNFKRKKSILYKTQEMFNSGRMRTLVSGKGIDVNKDEITTTNDTYSGFMSKGSGVLKNGGKNIDEKQSPDDVFVRAWSTMDSYNQYKDLQKHSALSEEGRVDNVDVASSVLGEFGLVKISPHRKNNIQKFMFSIENLAWDGETNKLLDCEKGPGDLLTGSKGRIMWFPPYDMVINESTSANWERSNFIGRGEPIYTYNNTERSGTLGWKIVVDHPNYLNFMKNRSDEEISAFFAGALDIEAIRNLLLSDDEKEAYEVSQNNKQKEGLLTNKEIGTHFSLFFPNNNTDVQYIIDSGYENGRDGNGRIIDKDNPEDMLYDGVLAGTPCSSDICDTPITYPDNTNFGYNLPSILLGDEEYVTGGKTPAWADSKFLSDLDNYMNEGDCKYCRVDVLGYASIHGTSSGNITLAANRAKNVKDYLVKNANIPASRIKASGAPGINSGCSPENSVDSAGCKGQREVSVDIVYDSSLEIADTGRVTLFDPNEPRPRPVIPLSRFYTECDYFEQIGADTDSFVARDIKSKIKNFHPAFHAITPEGFNSRLTFLQQCMRQGPTINDNTPDNLAFGRPPVCILRIGDFYHTKIIIESLTIDYEPLVWDLNPEGVGVQPMIANVNISFAFIGGSSMKGPINRLQNAISFNYFANTELYDPRAERIKKIEKPDKDGPFGEIIEGRFPAPKNLMEEYDKKPGIPNKSDVVIDQEEVAKVENDSKAVTSEPEESNDVKHLKNSVSVNFFSDNDGNINVVATDIDGLGDGWSYKVKASISGQQVELVKFTAINKDELTSSGKLEVNTNYKGSILVSRTKHYNTQTSFKRKYENGDIRASLTCYSGNTSNVTIPSAYIFVEFIKSGEETVSKSKFDTGTTFFYSSTDEDNDMIKNHIADNLYSAERNVLENLKC
tara:strand:- start:3076 stop:7455 length:4380 start_codon:yes stop_codon:yes gene_type:complete